MQYITMAIAIIGCVISVITFFRNGKNTETEETKEETKQFAKHDLIEYRLEKIEQNIEKILAKLDFYDKEIDERVSKAIIIHENMYHKGVK